MSLRAPMVRGAWLCLLLLQGCASHTAPTSPAPAAAPAPRPAAAEPPITLPPAVVANETFVTVDGVAWYRIGAGDVVEVVLTKEMAVDRVLAEVKPNGRVTLGFFEVSVAGLTTEQARGEIRRVLAPAYRELYVEVTVKEFRSKSVSVVGEVHRSGRFALKGKTGVLELFAEAGGPLPSADLRTVQLLRQNGQIYTLDLLRLVGDARFLGVAADAGDVLFVPTREEVKIFLLGAVERPGAYPYLPNMRLTQALAMAGGPRETAKLGDARIIRGSLPNAQVIQVDFEKAVRGEAGDADFALERNDLIVVPRSPIGNWNAFLGKLRPTLEIMTLPLAPLAQYYLLKGLVW